MSAVLKAFVKHQGALKRYLARCLRNAHDIDDVLHDTFVRAFATEIRTPVRAPKKLLFTAARHLVINHHTKKSHANTDYLEDTSPAPVLVDTDAIPADDQLDGRKKLRAFSLAVAQLPETARKVVVLRKFEGLTHKEIALRLDISISGVEKHVASGLLECAKHLRKMGYEPAELGIGRHTTLGRKLDPPEDGELTKLSRTDDKIND